MATEFGKELRKIRIDRDERLYDMAQRLKKSSAFISAIEVGKTSPPMGFEKEIADIYGLTKAQLEKLSHLADEFRKSFQLKPKTPESRQMVGMLARRLEELSNEDVRAIQSLLRKGGRNE